MGHASGNPIRRWSNRELPRSRPTTRYRRQRSGTPFEIVPAGVVEGQPLPATNPFNISETKTSDAPARDEID